MSPWSAVVVSIGCHAVVAAMLSLYRPADVEDDTETASEFEIVADEEMTEVAEEIAEPEAIREPEPVSEPQTTKPIITRDETPRATSSSPLVSDEASGTGDGPPRPAFGVAMSSSSGDGPAIPIGDGGGANSSGGGGQASAPTAAEASLTTLEAHLASKMPLPRGRCDGQYTDEAREAGLEGTVVVDLVVDASGRARDVHIVSGLDHGLSAAAVRAAKACRFTPGQRDGVAIAVRVRAFRIRFVLGDGG